MKTLLGHFDKLVKEEKEKKEKEAPKAVNSKEVANALAADVAEEVDPDEP